MAAVDKKLEEALRKAAYCLKEIGACAIEQGKQLEETAQLAVSSLRDIGIAAVEKELDEAYCI